MPKKLLTWNNLALATKNIFRGHYLIVHKVTRKINWWNICWKPSKLFFISIKFRCLFEACSLESVFKIWISDWAFKTNILVLVLAPMQYWVLIIKEISIFMYFLLNLLIKRTENFFFFSKNKMFQKSSYQNKWEYQLFSL